MINKNENENIGLKSEDRTQNSIWNIIVVRYNVVKVCVVHFFLYYSSSSG